MIQEIILECLRSVKNLIERALHIRSIDLGHIPELIPIPDSDPASWLLKTLRTKRESVKALCFNLRVKHSTRVWARS